MSHTRGWVAAGILLLASQLCAAQPPAAAPDILKVGTVVLHRCDSGAPWCATLSRPLDPSGVVPGTIDLYFEFYPHSEAGKSAGTLVATEGGPGYPATDSRDEYLELFGPLRGKRDVVLMDNRGTGRSGALDCHPRKV